MNEPEAGHAVVPGRPGDADRRRPRNPRPRRSYQYELARTYYFLGKRPGVQPGPPPPGPAARGARRPARRVSSSIRAVRAAWPFAGREGRRRRFPSAPAEGEENLEKAIAIWQHLVADDAAWPRRRPRRGPEGKPARRRDRPMPSPARLSPETVRRRLPGRVRRSEDSRQKAIDLLERLVAEHPAVPDYRHLLARCYREAPSGWTGRVRQSDDAVSRAAQILEKLVEEQPDVPDYRYDLSETYAMLDGRGPPAPELRTGPAVRAERCSKRR